MIWAYHMTFKCSRRRKLIWQQTEGSCLDCLAASQVGYILEPWAIAKVLTASAVAAIAAFAARTDKFPCNREFWRPSHVTGRCPLSQEFCRFGMVVETILGLSENAGCPQISWWIIILPSKIAILRAILLSICPIWTTPDDFIPCAIYTGKERCKESNGWVGGGYGKATLMQAVNARPQRPWHCFKP